MRAALANLSLLLFVVVCFTACRQHIFESAGIKALTVTSYKEGSVAGKVVIRDGAAIADFVNRVNRSEKDPAVFLPDYAVVVNYSQRELTILVNRDRLKIDGVAYRANEDVGATVASFLRASNKTLIPDVETTSGQSVNGIRAVRFLDQGEPSVEIVELAMPYAGKFMRRSRSWKRASERRLSHLGSTPK
jgi:hypothetical protein